MTQRDLARRSGLHEKTISSFESGARIQSIRFDQLLLLLRAFNMDPSDFFERVDKLRRDLVWIR